MKMLVGKGSHPILLHAELIIISTLSLSFQPKSWCGPRLKHILLTIIKLLIKRYGIVGASNIESITLEKWKNFVGHTCAYFERYMGLKRGAGKRVEEHIITLGDDESLSLIHI